MSQWLHIRDWWLQDDPYKGYSTDGQPQSWALKILRASPGYKIVGNFVQSGSYIITVPVKLTESKVWTAALFWWVSLKGSLQSPTWRAVLCHTEITFPHAENMGAYSWWGCSSYPKDRNLINTKTNTKIRVWHLKTHVMWRHKLRLPFVFTSRRRQ
jgi:hypothetical protein